MGFTLIGYREGEAPRDAKGQTLRRRAILNASDNTETTISALAYMASIGVVEGAAHPLNTFAQATNLTPSREERSQRVFYVDVDYATNALRTNNPAAERDNPLIRPSGRAFSTNPVTRTLTHSPITGAPLLNSADFLTPIEWPFTEWVITISRNETINSIAHYASFNDTIDTSGLLGAYPGETYLTIRHGEEHYESGLWYMRVDYEIHAMPRIEVGAVFTLSDDDCPLYNANGTVKSYSPGDFAAEATATDAFVSAFDVLELQQAYSYWNVEVVGMADVWTLRRFKDDNGEDSSEPQLLTATGERLLLQGERLGVGAAASKKPVYRAFQGKRRTDWSQLNLLAV